MMIPEPYDAWLPYIKYAFYAYSILTLVPQSWRRIKEHARLELENEHNRRKSCQQKVFEATKVRRRFDVNAVTRRKTIGTISGSVQEAIKPSTLDKSSPVNNGHGDTSGDYNFRENTNADIKGSYSVARIANEYERKAQKQKIHVASSDILRKRHTMSFFEGLKIPEVKIESAPTMVTSFQLNTSPIAAIDLSPSSTSKAHPPISNSISHLPSDKTENGDNIVNGQLSTHHNSGNFQQSPPDSPKSISPTIQLDVIRRQKKTGHVETVEDILVQQRFSRSLSSYSISELLKDQPTEPNIDQIINELH